MPKRPIFKLTKDAEGNHVPMVGIITAAYWHHSKIAKAADPPWDPQLKLLGKWDGLGDGDIYLPLGLVEDMARVGFLQDEGQGEGEADKYRILMPRARTSILKEKAEDGKYYIRFYLVDGATVAQTGPETTKSPPATSEAKESFADAVAQEKGFHKYCLALAAHTYIGLWGCPMELLSQDAVHAGGFTLLKRLEERHGITSVTEKQLENVVKALEKASHDARKALNPKDQ